MQNILAGAALGSIITALIGLAWHRAAVADLREKLEDTAKGRDAWKKVEAVSWKAFCEATGRLNRIKTQFKDGKSGTAKLAVKIARGEVA